MKTEDEFKAEVQALLDQFGQAILYGPPGTGKTRLARGVAAEILGLAAGDELEEEKERFQFVQFHPSYNYEDFVRGIRMETDDNGRVAYKTENRVFGEMAERALANKGEPHVLVIDEINRANVSAVLGELIYGLEMEYRGNKVQTPYEVDGGYGLTVPSNLKVIGTMNTADRTIGQIDYAVRRRFAFVQCLPDESVVADFSIAEAVKFFKKVDNVFAHLSADHDKNDVCIGHSYFLADSDSELARKIIYQVVPILREYLKDGVLGKEAEEKIDGIEKKARAMLSNMRTPLEYMLHEMTGEKNSKWWWFHFPSGKWSGMWSLRRAVWSLVKHCAKNKPCNNLDDLRDVFPDKIRSGFGVVQEPGSDKILSYQNKEEKFFLEEKDHIVFPDGKRAVVCTQWAREGELAPQLGAFRLRAHELGYRIYQSDRVVESLSCYYVNTGHDINCPHRAWEKCRDYGFMSAGQDENPNDSRSSVRQLRNIPLGAVVFAYRDGFGYVGCGVVTATAMPLRDFIKPKLEAQPSPALPDWSALAEDVAPHDNFDPDKEFAIGVDWLPDRELKGVHQQHHGRGTAHTISGDRLTDLKREFRIVDESDDAEN